jgi:hypothetical protein
MQVDNTNILQKPVAAIFRLEGLLQGTGIVNETM